MTVRIRWLVLAGVLVLIGGTVAGVLWVRRARTEAAPATVVLQAATDPGVDSFVPVASSRPMAVALPPAGTSAEVTATVDPGSGVRVVSGTAGRLYAASTPGNQELYGGSGTLSACDPAAIAAFLKAHPDKAAAWAGVLDIGTDAIPGYLDGLTPVVLVHDTEVMNHGFDDGAATAFLSVLQAGTAVLVDATGLPVVRCACGNPLTSPPRMSLSAALVQGTPWDGYDPDATVTVVPGSVVSQFVVVDVVTGQDITLAAGPAADPHGTPTTTASTSASATPATTPSADTGRCTLELAWPEATSGWIEPLDPSFTCQAMIDQWRRYEQYPGERGGTLAVVDWDDGWYCTVVHRNPAGPATNAEGDCDLGGRRFNVYTGEPGPVGPSVTSPATSSEPPVPSAGITGTVVQSDVFVTPSQNIRCADLDNTFACTIKEYDFDLGPCEIERGPFVTLGATGPARLDTCVGDFFAGVPHWPDPAPYGTTVRTGQIACDVEQTGVTCTNDDGHGFMLARAGYTAF